MTRPILHARRMSTVLALLLGGVLLAADARAQRPTPPPAPPPARPNILVILTDDQRWDAIGVVQREMGKDALFPWLRTPNLDRLAAEGARFSNAFVTTSLCSPSRASFLSGRYARRHQVLNNFTEYPDDLPSYPRRLKDAGYETAYIGKWHMGEDNDAQRPGFDHWMSHRGQGNYFDNEFNIDGRRRRIEGYYTTVVTDHAVEWIGKSHSKPWLLVLGQKAPHGGPIQPEPRFASALDTFPVREPASYGNYRAADGKPAWLEQSLGTWHGARGPLYDLGQHDRLVRTYLATLLSIDESVGRVYEALRASGQLDDTVVVFTSDNGFVLGEHGRVDKRTMYEESIRVPLLVRYPRVVKAGTVVTQMAISHDLAPTLIALGGGEPLPDITGRSLVPLLRGTPTAWRDGVPLRVQLREAVSLHAQCTRRADRWLEADPLSAGRWQRRSLHGGTLRPAAGPARAAQPDRRPRPRVQAPRPRAPVRAGLARCRPRSDADLRRHRRRPAGALTVQARSVGVSRRRPSRRTPLRARRQGCRCSR